MKLSNDYDFYSHLYSEKKETEMFLLRLFLWEHYYLIDLITVEKLNDVINAGTFNDHIIKIDNWPQVTQQKWTMYIHS